MNLSSKNLFPVATLSNQWANTERSRVASLIPCHEHLPRQVMHISKINPQLSRHLKESKQYEGGVWSIICLPVAWQNSDLPVLYRSIKFCLHETKILFTCKNAFISIYWSPKNIVNLIFLARSLICSEHLLKLRQSLAIIFQALLLSLYNC